MKVKYILLIAIFSLTATVNYGQIKNERKIKQQEKKERINQLILQEEQGALIFQKQSTFGVKLNTDGYGIFYELGKMKTARKANLYSLEIGERKHIKEEKVSPDGGFFSNPFVYGKVNNFYYAKLGFGQQRIIGNKGNRNGVAVSAVYGGGLTAGLLKPYYLKVADPDDPNGLVDVKYNNNNDVFLNNNDGHIKGSSGFSKGFGEMKLTPGIFTKTAIRFDYGRYNELVSALEVGLNVEFYTQKMQQLLLVKNKQLFFNAYAAIEFGRRK